MNIRSTLEEFNYSPAPVEYQKESRTKKEKQTLDNGAQYDGEWDSNGKKDGKGV